ncbi:peptide-methionine (R)-S-oxide reductase MsrB [Patescibacteria group bacterium]|nr:peptide-methionine (R)-S-oxide reductase MsrB [Patescibacteria group bacterium]
MNKIEKTNEEWKQELTPEQYRVLRESGTEAPFTGEYTSLDKDGTYRCAACGNQLFASDNKFESGCGWPSFDDVANSEAIETRPDTSHGMQREEVICARCGGHLGHVFPDGPKDTTELRYCINSVALDFKPKNQS